jgi:parallel beta-helix repeat protein
MATSHVTPAARMLATILCLCLMISACETEDALQVPQAASLDGHDRAGDVAASEARGDTESASESDTRGAAAESTSAGCDHVIPSDVEEADGASNFSDVAPGDTVCISAGTRDPLALRNFHGADGRAITFVNDGGTVTIRGDGGDYAGIEIEDSDHIRVTGSGVDQQCGAGVAAAAQRCGIRVLGAARGLTGKVRTEHLRVDHVEMGDTAQSAVSIKDNSMGRDEWVERDIVLDHNYVHDVHDEGFYIGSSDYASGEYHVLHGVHLAHNLVARTGRDGLQVGSAAQDCTIHHNVIRETGRNDESSHRAGVMNNKGSVCDIFNNTISDTAGWGIYVQGNGGNEIYNNVVVRAGRFVDPGDNDGDGISVREGSNVSRGVRVWSNTIISARGDGIGWHSDVGAENQIRNNIVVASGGVNIDGDSNVEIADNLVADSVSTVKFLDEAGDDYRLSAASPAIDSGGSLTALGVTDDIDGVARPQGEAYDIGAHERPAG